MGCFGSEVPARNGEASPRLPALPSFSRAARSLSLSRCPIRPGVSNLA